MAFLRAWLVPRVAFWLIWTAWLWCLQSFLVSRVEALPGSTALLFVVGPPVLVAFLGSRLVNNPLDTAMALFWKGAALSCLLGMFALFFLMKTIGWGPQVLLGGTLICGYLGLRGPGMKKVALTQGELFDRAQFIARRSGVALKRVIVFKSLRNLPAAFAQRNTDSILLSDRLLRLLSRREAEAVIAHEAAHFRPAQKMVVSAVPMLAAILILTGSFWPEAKTCMPFVPILSVFLWRALRRRQEYDADANAVLATGDPEALIAALTRISAETGMPLHWGPAAGLFLPHPPMTARFRAIAKRTGLTAVRVEELIAATGAIPPLPGFASPFDQAQPEGILAAHRERLDKRMLLLSKGFPVLAGVGLVALERSLDPDALTLIAHTAAWIVASMVVFWILYEVVAGSERRRLRDQLPDAYRAGSIFAGISTAAEPRFYEGLYHYDLGMARIDGGSLNFAGTRCSFSIGSSQARRVWLANGPRHWTPRKVVCVEYQREDGKPSVVSLQSLERWFWPGTSAAAQELYATVSGWSKTGEPASAAVVLPPEIAAPAVPRVTPGAVWKSMKVLCLISLCAGWMVFQIPSLAPGMLTPFAAPVVTAALIFFFLGPHVKWSRRYSMPSPSVQTETK